MACAIGSCRMTALAWLARAEKVGHQKFAVQYIGRELQNVDEANLLDEEDMHVFGLRPLTDPLDLVCCKACKKPVKASQYVSHAELCKFLSSRNDISLELDSPVVNRKPQRKERKKKAKSVREPNKFAYVDRDIIAARESHIDENIQMSPFPEAQRNMFLNSTHKLNGSRAIYTVDCAEDATKSSLKPLKRSSTENPNPGTKNSYVPAPLATKVYYSQRNHRLRRAICHMFFDESNKEPSCEVPISEALQVNDAPIQTSSPGNCCHENVANQQRRGNFSHLARTPDQIFAARSDFYVGKSGTFIPCMDTAAQLAVNNNLGPPYISNSYTCAD